MLLSLFALITLLTNPSAAQDNKYCKKIAYQKDYQTEVRVIQQYPSLSYSRIPRGELIKKAGDASVLGLTESKLETSFQFKIREHRTIKGICLFIERVTFTVGYETLQVYIDDSYGTKTCEYAAIRKHEHTHVHIERSTLHKFKPRIMHAVRKFFRKNPPLFVAYRQHLIRTRRNWEKSLQNVPEVMQLRKELRAAQEVRHQKIDTKESYAAVRKRCGNW